MTADHPDEPTVPVSELRELIWEWLYNGYDQNHPNSKVAHKVNKMRAKELEELVEQYE